jgi:hypothetical protein
MGLRRAADNQQMYSNRTCRKVRSTDYPLFVILAAHLYCERASYHIVFQIASSFSVAYITICHHFPISFDCTIG